MTPFLYKNNKGIFIKSFNHNSDNKTFYLFSFFTRRNNNENNNGNN